MGRLLSFIAAVLMTPMSVRYLDAYPDRIPVDEHPEICESMDPSGHNTTALVTECPYKIIFNTNGCYTENQKIFVTIYHQMENGFFEGVFLQARKTDGSTRSIGTFDNNGDPMFKPYSCSGSVNNTFGHCGHDHFFKTVLTWTPPPGLDNDVQFVATMVRSTYRYWMNVRSPVLRYERSCSQFSVTDPPLVPTMTSGASRPTTNSHSCYFLTSVLSLPMFLIALH